MFIVAYRLLGFLLLTVLLEGQGSYTVNGQQGWVSPIRKDQWRRGRFISSKEKRLQNIDDLRDRYSLEYEIGCGSVARVYRGYDRIAGRSVAVKIMHNPKHEQQRHVFQHGADIAKEVSHPNIARTHEIGEALFDGRRTPYVVMEYIPGITLQNLIDEKGRLSGDAVTIIGTDIASALSHAHSKGIVHRDLKPANVLITPDNIAVLVDFTPERDLGAAIVQERSLGPGQTRYASPEHLQQGAAVGTASDVYSLGATLYRIVAGRALFGGDPLQVACKHLSHRPMPLDGLAHINSRLDHMIMRSLAKAPHLRPSASEFATALIYELLQKYGWSNWYRTLRKPHEIRSGLGSQVSSV